jgi:hypothetical protein
LNEATMPNMKKVTELRDFVAGQKLSPFDQPYIGLQHANKNAKFANVN